MQGEDVVTRPSRHVFLQPAISPNFAEFPFSLSSLWVYLPGES